MMDRFKIYGTPVGLLVLSVLTLGFAAYSFSFGLGGLTGTDPGSRFFVPGAVWANIGIGVHMMTGAVITVLTPLQLIPALRRRAPAWHRRMGYLLVVCAVPTAVGGLIFISYRGTIGGPVMNIGFSLYGCLIGLSALQAMRHARARNFDLHYAWALRFFVLAIGSWLYRVHYGIWYALTDGLGSQPDFRGTFDVIQVFAFYLPYLAMVELYLRRKRSGAPI